MKSDSIKAAIKELSKSKERLTDLVITDPLLTPLEKIQLLTERKLFKIDSYIKRPFMTSKDPRIVEFLKENTSRRVFEFWEGDDSYQRNETVLFYNWIERLEIDWDDDTDEVDPFTLITVLRAGPNEFKSTYAGFVDFLLAYMIETKTIGFYFDW